MNVKLGAGSRAVGACPCTVGYGDIQMPRLLSPKPFALKKKKKKCLGNNPLPPPEAQKPSAVTPSALGGANLR